MKLIDENDFVCTKDEVSEKSELLFSPRFKCKSCEFFHYYDAKNCDEKFTYDQLNTTEKRSYLNSLERKNIRHNEQRYEISKHLLGKMISADNAFSDLYPVSVESVLRGFPALAVEMANRLIQELDNHHE